MQTTYTAAIKHTGDWWIGWIEEVPGVNCQERTKEGLLKSLWVSMQEALALNRADAIRAAGSEDLTVAASHPARICGGD